MKQPKHDKKVRKEQGITLVALVVTIVVLLILSGITLTYAMGDNGIIKKAQEAKNKMEQAMQNEQQEIGDLENWLNKEYMNESNPVESNPPKKMISFKINCDIDGEFSYQAEEGMTWSDFENSLYNPSGLGHITKDPYDSDFVAVRYYDGTVNFEAYGWLYDVTKDEDAAMDDLIVNGMTYRYYKSLRFSK